MNNPTVIDVTIPGHRPLLTYDEWMEASMSLLLDPGHVLVSRPWFDKFAAINNRRHEVNRMSARALRAALKYGTNLPPPVQKQIRAALAEATKKLPGEI
jgi:hypothetical protein